MPSTRRPSRTLRTGVSLAALMGLVLQPTLAEAQGGGGNALNACATERAPLVQLDKDYEQMKRSKMGAAVGEGIKRGAGVIASGVMSGGIGLPGGRGGGIPGGFGGVVGSFGSLAAQAGAARAVQPAAAPGPTSLFGPDILSGALSLNVPGIGGGGGDSVKAYAALAVLVAIVGSAEAYAQLKEQEASGDLQKASFNIDQDAGRQVTVSRQMADSGRALADCRTRQLGDIETRLASASNDRDRRELRRERTQLVGALKQDIDLTGDVLTEQQTMAKTFTQGRAMTDGTSEAEVLGGQAPAYADAASTARLGMPAKKIQASTGAAPGAAAPAPPAAPPPDLVALRATVVLDAPVASAGTLMNLPAGRAVKPKTAQAEGGWWEIDVAGSPGYVRAADLGPPGSAPAPTQTAGRGGPGGRGRAGAAAAAPPLPPAPVVEGPTNIRSHNQTVIAARDTGKTRLSSLLTDIQTSQRRDSVLLALLERIGWG